MSTAHAIAAVTKLLTVMIDDTMKAANLAGIVGSDVVVSALSPRRVDLSHASDPNQVNVFLYLALPNHGGSGFDLPTRDASGARVRNTPLALDLYYLVTAYGADDGFAEIVLGHAMQALHENPIVPRDAIRTLLQPGANPTNAQLAIAAAGLADQAEQIKVSPEKLTTEEISRLWTALGAEYRPSVAYRVTVVLIEARAATRGGLPVLRRGVYVRQRNTPLIERIAVKAAPDEPALEGQPILPGALVVVGGKRLLGEITRIVIDGSPVDDSDAFLSPENVGFTLPDTLRAGPHGAQIVHDVVMGSPPVPHAGSSSNVARFLLRPVVIEPVVTTDTTIRVELHPPVTPSQKVRLLLNQLDPAPGKEAQAFSFGAPDRNGVDLAGGETEADTIDFRHSGVPTGTYLVRVQVDGAESVLELDPATGAYVGPSVDVP
jgi:hypothetical protein